LQISNQQLYNTTSPPKLPNMQVIKFALFSLLVAVAVAQDGSGSGADRGVDDAGAEVTSPAKVGKPGKGKGDVVDPSMSPLARVSPGSKVGKGKGSGSGKGGHKGKAGNVSFGKMISGLFQLACAASLGCPNFRHCTAPAHG
jgi:hypothetical protein